MKTYETKKQLSDRLSGSCLTGRTTIVVFTTLLICAGCDTWRLEESISSENLKTGLDKIETVQLAEHSTSPPVTIEQATEQIAQQVTEPNEPRRTLTLSIEQVRAAALVNNLDLKVELVSPSIAQRIIDEEQAKFESTIFGSTNYQRNEALGTGAISKAQTSELGIEKPLPTGGEIQIGLPFSDDYSSGGLADAAASVSYIQSLLNGAGTRINTQSIRIARHQWNITSARTKLVAIRLLANADIGYWRLYAARKELEVRREQYKLAQDQLSHARKKVAAGSSPKIEIVRAEAGLASRLAAVINAETTVQNRQRDILSIMNQEDTPLEAVVDIVTQTDSNPLGLELDDKQLAEQALANRMEMMELEQRLTIDDLNIELARNALLPNLTLSYTYTTRAQDGTLPGTFEDLQGNSFDGHSVGISAAIPLGNRAAKARLQRSKLEKIQDMSARDRYQQIIRQEVYEAVNELQGSWRRILAAEQGVTAAYRDYRVEQSQFQLGISTSTNVLYSATGLADAQLRRIYAFADYEIAQINLARATGTLLGHGQILIASVDINARNP
ncbi:MAG: TolC family protein [Sedimentisphaerales bacterium]